MSFVRRSRQVQDPNSDLGRHKVFSTNRISGEVISDSCRERLTRRGNRGGLNGLSSVLTSRIIAGRPGPTVDTTRFFLAAAGASRRTSVGRLYCDRHAESQIVSQQINRRRLIGDNVSFNLFAEISLPLVNYLLHGGLIRRDE